jgi:diphthine-ammonia ligase
MKCVALISGGKDSWYNVMHSVSQGHQILALANLRPPITSPGSQPRLAANTDELDSFMYQTVGHDAVHLQAECMSLPLYRGYITGESLSQTLNYSATTGDEAEDLYCLLQKVRIAHPEIQGVSVGAILSNYQRTRVEDVCARLGLTCLAFLWEREQKELLAEMINSGLTAIVIKVAAMGPRLAVSADLGLKRLHLGKRLGELYPTLLSLVHQPASH